MRVLFTITLLFTLSLFHCQGSPPFIILDLVDTHQLVGDDDSQNDITLTLSYIDDDGNLGGGFFHAIDSRDSEYEYIYDIPPISPFEQAIRGQMDVVVYDIRRIDPEPISEEFTLEIFVTDYATDGEPFESNRVETDRIIIR